jgi:hypothetical protein
LRTRCDRCGSVTCGSHREHAPQRPIRRANKVAAKLHLYEWSEQPTERPLHMRTGTFELLKVEKSMMAEMINDRLNRQFLRSARPLERNSSAVRDPDYRSYGMWWVEDDEIPSWHEASMHFEYTIMDQRPLHSISLAR